VSRRRVEGIACFVRLFSVGEPKDDLSLNHVSPVRTLATVIWKSFEKLCGIRVSGVGRETDRVAIKLLGAAFEDSLDHLDP